MQKDYPSNWEYEYVNAQFAVFIRIIVASV